MIITPLLVIFNVIIFILLFLFLLTIDKRKWLAIVLSFALTPLVYFYMFYPMLNIFSSYHHQKYFNIDNWEEHPNLRYEMTQNIIASQLLIGKTKKEVQNSLGPYEWLGWDTITKAPDPNNWHYSLGTKPGAFNTMKECLELCFKENKVVNILTYQEKIKLDAAP